MPTYIGREPSTAKKLAMINGKLRVVWAKSYDHWDEDIEVLLDEHDFGRIEN